MGSFFFCRRNLIGWKTLREFHPWGLFWTDYLIIQKAGFIPNQNGMSSDWLRCLYLLFLLVVLEASVLKHHCWKSILQYQQERHLFSKGNIDMRVWNFQPRSESSQKLLGLEKKDLKGAFPNSLSSPLVCSEVISVYLRKPGDSMWPFFFPPNGGNLSLWKGHVFTIHQKVMAWITRSLCFSSQATWMNDEASAPKGPPLT